LDVVFEGQILDKKPLKSSKEITVADIKETKRVWSLDHIDHAEFLRSRIGLTSKEPYKSAIHSRTGQPETASHAEQSRIDALKAI